MKGQTDNGESNIRDTEKTMDKGSRELVTDVTDVTGFKSAYTLLWQY